MFGELKIGLLPKDWSGSFESIAVDSRIIDQGVPRTAAVKFIMVQKR